MKKGFTILEISLFIAISGLLILGVILATNNNIGRQRFNDSVQDFADYLRGAYSSVLYTKNLDIENPGRSGKAIYGKVLVFGEEKSSNSSKIYSYDVIGDAVNSQDSSALSKLDNLSALVALNVFFDYETRSSETPLWSASIESTSLGDIFKGAILIVRSPVFGTVYTYVLRGDISFGENTNLAKYITSPTNTSEVVFKTSELDLCLDSPDRFAASSYRQNIRILSSGRNSTAVTLVNIDTDENKCK